MLEGEENESIYYFPLTREDGNSIGQFHEIVLVEIANLAKSKEDPNTFVIVRDTVGVPFIPADIDSANYDQEGHYLQNLVQLINYSQRTFYMAEMVRNFCNTCGGHISDFITYVERRSQEENIPTEIIFGIMYKESAGDCTEKNENQSELSIGLLQLNTKDSTNLNQCSNGIVPHVEPKHMEEACRKNNYRSGSPCNPSYKSDMDRTLICLNNPYCNFEESLNSINCKWLTVYADRCIENSDNSFSEEMTEICKRRYKDGAPLMPMKSWEKMNSIERDLWRYVIAYYNTGTYVNDIEDIITNQDKVQLKKNLGLSEKANDWYLMREYVQDLCLVFPEDHLLFEKGEGYRTKMCNHFAYTDEITGNVIISVDQPNRIRDWLIYKKNNSPIQCSESNTIKI